MNTVVAFLGRYGLSDTSQFKVLAGPILILMVMSMMILPLPPFVLDMLFTFNIALSIMVLLVSMFTTRPLDFAAFPSVLLFATLLRLALNVASTRVILMHGDEGPASAGQVIKAFGEFLVGGNYAVGLIVFLILILINFMVITKGAGRIAEVGARFTLDALPGKQMAIDADLNAGIIDEEQARARREEAAREADFYGSMDGASKFVRGDAIAGILIMIINLIGGLIVGVLQHEMPISEAAHSYTLLTVGDGLVAQVPALIISTAAGVTVSRVASENDIGQQLITQLFSKPIVMFLAAGVLGLLALVPGMPNLVFLFYTVTLAGIGYWLWRHYRKAESRPAPAEEATAVADAERAEEASWDDVQPVDPLGLEVGYRLIGLVDAEQDGQLLRRIKGIRKKFATDIGFLPPVVHIRDNLEQPPHTYVLSMNGVEIGQGEAYPSEWLAIDPGQAEGELSGRKAKEPAFGLPATWVSADDREQAESQGYTVVDAATVVATHINTLLTRNAAEMLGRTETQALLDRVKTDAPQLVEDTVPKTVSLATLNTVLKNLLEEDVSIRDMRRILETLAAYGAESTDAFELTASVRMALGRAIVQYWFGAAKQIEVMSLDGQLEQMLMQAIQNGGGMEPGLAQTLLSETESAVEQQLQRGEQPVLIVAHDLRFLLARFLRRNVSQLVVLSQNEIPDDINLRVTILIGSESNT